MSDATPFLGSANPSLDESGAGSFVPTTGASPISGTGLPVGGYLGAGTPSFVNYSSPVMFMQGSRSIAGITPSVPIREEHEDDMEITRRPVEAGAPITDHAYLMPSSVTMEIGFDGTQGPGGIYAAYEALLNVRATLQPFTVVTGKRMYQNMMMVRLGVITDERTENVLMVTARLEQIIITTTQAVTVPSSATMQNPASNASPTTGGTVQPQVVQQPSPSVLSSLTGYGQPSQPVSINGTTYEPGG